MCTATFVCILLLCVSGTAAAQEWTEYVDTQNGFKLNFPGQPKVTETTWTSQMNYTSLGACTARRRAANATH